MKKIILLVLIGITLGWDNQRAFQNNKETKFDSLYNRYSLLIVEVNDIQKSLYKLQETFGNISDIIDTTESIKNRASNFKKDTNSEIKRIDSDMYYSSNILLDQDSIITEELSDLNDRFFSYRNKSKISISSLNKTNKTLQSRIDALEKKIVYLYSRLGKI